MTRSAASKRSFAYADPPYIGQAKLYKAHADYGGEVDHAELARRLGTYDGFVLHTSSPTLYEVETHLHDAGITDYRVMQWVKSFAAFKRNVSVAYAYEPVIVRPLRKPVVKKGLGLVYRDWIAESITLKKGLTGVKPEKVCRWAFEMAGAEPQDTLDDMFPGTWAVTRAWETWQEGRTRVGGGRSVTRSAAYKHEPLMKTATYQLLGGGERVVEYDANAPCWMCGEPVVEASTGGTVVCPWCDCGTTRDGTKWTLAECFAAHERFAREREKVTA